MSKRAKRKMNVKKSEAVLSKAKIPLTTQTMLWLLHLPRLARILITGILALAVTLVLSLVIFYQSLFYSSGLQLALMIFAAVMGLAMYLAGWQLIVGTVGQTPPARLAIIWYLGIGCLSIFLIVLWFLQGFQQELV